jgi:Xaa-Pro aminopeptidase
MHREKLEQARGILGELGLDLWLTFVRETSVTPDPALEVLLGTGVTWQSAFLVPRGGETVAIVGSLDRANVEGRGVFDRVVGYVEGVSAPLLEELRRIDPAAIAVNYSLDTEIADGLTHGMYLLLCEILKETPYAGRLVSSAPLIGRLRGRKTPAELALLREAAREAAEILYSLRAFIRPGMSEKEIADHIVGQVRTRGLSLAWDPEQCPAVFTGPESAGAHAGPTGRVVEPGHVLNIDFGVLRQGYCSDLQRTFYVLRPGEQGPPAEVLRGYRTIVEAVQKAASFLRPGVMGHEVDAIARGHIVAAGYAEYPHALGHQIGRKAHDGAGLLCPIWERYGRRPFERVEEGQVYTIEPRLTVAGHGIATVEEMVVVTATGCEYLSPPQDHLWLVRTE